jgi:two-component system phosphate regulon sensor histidine kinase PhoR
VATVSIAALCAVAAGFVGWLTPGAKQSAGLAPQAATAASPSAEQGDDSLVFTTALLNGLTDPYLLLDSKRRVIFANSAAEALFGRSITSDDVALHLRQPAALAAIDAVHLEGGERSTEIHVPGPVVRTFLLRASRLLDPRLPSPTRLLQRSRFTTAISLHDITHIRQAEQMRADFVANVSHELRTPLASLVGFIETLQGAASKDEAARMRFLGIMQREAARMTRLIEDLLSLSRIELDEYTPPKDLVDLAGVLKGTKESIQPRAESKSATVTLNIAEGLPRILGDRDQLIEVFQNLVENAIKYGRTGGSVEIAARVAESAPQIVGPAVIVAVKDNGPGIASEHIPRLTERFYRVDSARSRELGGTGLGLAIVKHIVNRHRGNLTIASKEGVGSTFSVSFPIPRTSASPS